MGSVCDGTQRSHDQNLDLARRIGVIEEWVIRRWAFWGNLYAYTAQSW